MGKNTKLEWCDHTWNPWIGCTKVSPGCAHCYAEAMMDHRYHRVQWGEQGSRDRTSPENWKKPLRWNRQAEKENRRYRVFCASLADVFEDNTQVYDWRIDLWEQVIRPTPKLDWMLLTKRVEVAAEFIPHRPLSNVWLGVSVCTQEECDRILPQLPKLRQHVAGIFLSCEPLLEQIQFPAAFASVDWVLVGGETGNKSRPCDLRWLRSVIQQCQQADLPVFVKQLGSNAVNIPSAQTQSKRRRGKMNHPQEWPEELRIRQFPD